MPHSCRLTFLELTYPHGGVRPCQQKSTCITQLTFGPNVVQIWSHNIRKSERTKPSNFTEWLVCLRKSNCLAGGEGGGVGEGQGDRALRASPPQRFLNPKPKPQIPKPKTQNPKPETRNPKLEIEISTQVTQAITLVEAGVSDAFLRSDYS